MVRPAKNSHEKRRFFELVAKFRPPAKRNSMLIRSLRDCQAGDLQTAVWAELAPGQSRAMRQQPRFARLKGPLVHFGHELASGADRRSYHVGVFGGAAHERFFQQRQRLVRLAGPQIDQSQVAALRRCTRRWGCEAHLDRQRAGPIVLQREGRFQVAQHAAAISRGGAGQRCSSRRTSFSPRTFSTRCRQPSRSSTSPPEKGSTNSNSPPLRQPRTKCPGAFTPNSRRPARAATD